MSLRHQLAAGLGLALAATGLPLLSLPSARANIAGTGLVISEAYGGGGNAGSTWKNDFVELYNPTSAAISVEGWSLQARPATNTSVASAANSVNLHGSVPARGYYLIQEAAGTGGSKSLPKPDAVGSAGLAAGGWQVWLADTTTLLDPADGNVVGTDAHIVDFVGGATNATSYEQAAVSAAPSATASSLRTPVGSDTDNNRTDFPVGTPSPTNAAGQTESPDPVVGFPGNRVFLVNEPITPFTLTATGGTGPYTWSTAAALPGGLSLDGDTVSGTPTALGTTSVTVTATDSATPAGTGSSTFTISVADPTVTTPIADIQGTGDVSPKAGSIVTADGVVTALYREGGLDGLYLQTGGTGGATDATPGASDAIFVFARTGAPALPAGIGIGDSVRVTGAVSEFNGLTELTADLGTITELGTALPAVTPLATAYPRTTTGREAHEGELIAPTDQFTVTNTFATNQFAEIGLATGDHPLVQPTEVALPSDPAALDVVKADNAARAVTLDDGATINFLTNGSPNQDLPLPWLTRDSSVRVGAQATLHQPVILDFRNSTWKLQPTRQVTDRGVDVATFQDTRTPNLRPAVVGGDLKLATYNVQNYFTTTGADYVSYGGTCTWFDDRDGNHIGVNSCSSPTGGAGPRGAATQVSFERQRAKIVTAINALGADIVSLEEIENSMKLAIARAGAAAGSPASESWRDEALADLVKALNAGAGAAGTWAFVPSPTEATTAANISAQDVIRTGFIYKRATVVPVGMSDIYFGEPADPAFANAREPLAQVFKPKGHPNSDGFAVVVNHFKSKGNSTPPATGDNANSDDTGAFNGDRTRQADSLQRFATSFAAARGVDKIFLTGDFNSYSKEDPVALLESKGFQPVESDDPSDESYSFGGLSGSLDHVFANAAAMNMVAGADVWNINAEEPIAYNYSRFNYNATDFFDASVPFSGSDHNPEIVGLNVAGAAGQRDIQILGTNDFHGRLQNNTGNTEAGAAVLAGAVKQLRAQNPDTVFAAAGDLIGASTFESFIQKDKPTIDALNEAGLEVSAVGNHEFDQGYQDLVDRVMAPYDATTNPYGGAKWQYVGANVKVHATGNTLVPASWVKDLDGVQVGFIGAVTEDLPSLVSPSGMQGIDVTPIVAAANAEADVLKQEGVDIVVLLVHEGAPGTDCATMDDDPTSAFGKIISGVNAGVDAIISGHTHLEYNCSFPVQSWIDAGRAVTRRPVVSAGQYGMALDQLVYTVDATGAVTGLTQNTLDLKGSSAAFNYPADPATASVVSDAVAKAGPLGAQVLGKLGGGFSRAKFAGGGENRGGESTLGNLVAEVQRAQTPATVGGAQIAFMNPGGLRADMLGSGTGAFPRDLTYAQAAGVQPFANTLVNMDLTGAQIKTALEQQWQRAANGTVPSRAFLKLGVSDGFTYTYTQAQDPAQPAGVMKGTVTGMWLDGVPLRLGSTYSVTVNSFLAAGGDNFFELGKGTAKQDTGVTDLQAMVDYMRQFGTDALPVDYGQHGVGVAFPSGAPATYRPGDHVVFDLSSLSMTGKATGIAPDPTDAEVRVALGDAVLGTFPVTTTVGSSPDNSAGSNDDAGTAHVDVVLPAGAAAGPADLHVVGATTGTDVVVPVDVEPGTLETGTPTIDDTTPGVGDVLTADPGVWGPQPVELTYQWLADGAPIAGATQRTFTVTTAQAGRALSVTVTGAKVGYRDASATSAATTRVPRLTPTVTVTAVTMASGRSAVVTVRVAAPGTAPTGTVRVERDGTVLGSAALIDGVARVTVPKSALVPASRLLTAAYGGDVAVAEGSTTFRSGDVR